jgi:hypothetical protein
VTPEKLGNKEIVSLLTKAHGMGTLNRLVVDEVFIIIVNQSLTDETEKGALHLGD